MRIAVHAKLLSYPQLAGPGYYTYNLLSTLSKIDGDNEYVLYSNKPLCHRIKGDNFQERILNFPYLWTYFRFPFEFLDNKFDIVFIPKELVPPFIRPKCIMTVFDHIEIMQPEQHSLSVKLNHYLTTKYHIRAADRIIAISDTTKNDILKRHRINPDKIIVTPLGYDQKLFVPAKEENIRYVKHKYGINGPYLINTSSVLWYRKNIPRLIKAYHLVKVQKQIDHQLVITGKAGDAYQEILALIQSLKLEKDVLLLGYVPLEDIPILLSAATALVFPSLHEGFGLPLIEAMACGCLVISSDCSAIPEVVGKAGILINPYNIDELSDAIALVLSESNLQAEMKRRGFEQAKTFSWERTARLTMKVFEELNES